MSLASQVSTLATAIGAKIKIATPITKHKIEMFGLLPATSSIAQTQTGSSVYYFGLITYGLDGGAVGSTSTWFLNGHWSGTYSLVIYYGKTTNTGILKVEISKDGGSTWTSLSTTLDTYASASQGAAITFTAITIPEGSDVLVRFTAIGKNASSTAYFCAVSGWELHRTGP